MKKILALLLTAALLLSLAACGKDKQKEENNAAAITELQNQLVGNWTHYNWIYNSTSNHLVFNADGTGSYQGGVVEDGKYEFDYTFTYTITIAEKGDKYKYTVNQLTIQYNEVDDSETRDFRFLDTGALYLVYADHQIIQFDDYIREEDIPQPEESDTESLFSPHYSLSSKQHPTTDTQIGMSGAV